MRILIIHIFIDWVLSFFFLFAGVFSEGEPSKEDPVASKNTVVTRKRKGGKDIAPADLSIKKFKDEDTKQSIVEPAACIAKESSAPIRAKLSRAHGGKRPATQRYTNTRIYIYIYIYRYIYITFVVINHFIGLYEDTYTYYVSTYCCYVSTRCYISFCIFYVSHCLFNP